MPSDGTGTTGWQSTPSGQKRISLKTTGRRAIRQTLARGREERGLVDRGGGLPVSYRFRGHPARRCLPTSTPATGRPLARRGAPLFLLGFPPTLRTGGTVVEQSLDSPAGPRHPGIRALCMPVNAATQTYIRPRLRRAAASPCRPIPKADDISQGREVCALSRRDRRVPQAGPKLLDRFFVATLAYERAWKCESTPAYRNA